ncbi:outer membrane protein [Hoeflea prorocentri]|uniref:Outer membrane beta-barrel protein n=1 Tax=Hoeflea prorocentri TaxID=1922333 RepID=A0A9X3UDB6_9HYPH|nr:outer membrane beta-barrel protein [Hoeflea prorocentri]MCY6379322.1 outer membrane beta-barrel protein [Hoeflea prorocentri]MDA5397123.1 outer membrane beta-barrel protein [Hoeflea prorocentri]
MMKSFMSRSLIAALLLGSSSAALSADLDNIIYAPELPRTKPVEVGNGWYLRGDVSYDFSTSGSGDTFRTYDGVSYTARNFTTSSFDTDWGAGIGFGYQFSNWLRAEAMLNYQQGTLDGSYSSAVVPCSTPVLGTGCSVVGSGEFDSYSAMTNGYIDLGTYAGFTPYVGAGAGMTYVSYDSFNAQETCIGGACPVAPPASVTRPGESDWRFTYALMAGVAYEFMRNLKVDVGYRYTNVSGGDAFGFDGTSAAGGATGVQGTDNGYSTHAVTTSLRYSLW